MSSVGIADRDEESITQIEAEGIEVTHKEAVFALVDLVERLGLIGFDGRNCPFKSDS